MSLTGQQVGKYRVGPLVGQGSVAQVYMGEPMGGHMARKVAIKVLLAEHCANAELVNRFMNEAQALGRINHPGVVSVFDVERLQDGRVSLIMEFLNGQNLREWLRQRGRLSVEEALYLTIQLSDALAAAHDQGIVHRDVNPDNIFVIMDHAGLRTKILDFGVAKLIGDSGLVRTGTQAQLGTAAYMSPEQFRSSKDVDHRADIYALGCVFFEMLCGHTPFVASNLVDHMRAHALQPPPPVRSIVPTVPLAIEQVIQRMLAKSPAERFGSMRELKQMLEIIQAGGHPDVFASVHAPVASPMNASSPSRQGAAGQAGQQAGEESAGSGLRVVIIVVTALVIIGGALAAMFLLG